MSLCVCMPACFYGRRGRVKKNGATAVPRVRQKRTVAAASAAAAAAVTAGEATLAY